MQNGHIECLILKKAQHKYSIVLLLRPISGEQITDRPGPNLSFQVAWEKQRRKKKENIENGEKQLYPKNSCARCQTLKGKLGVKKASTMQT
jgi:hypothetical protein